MFDNSVTGRGSVTFLGDYFFNPPIANMSQQRGIIVLHEAVHQVGGRGDTPFGGSKALSEKIIQKCYPVLKGKLGVSDESQFFDAVLYYQSVGNRTCGVEHFFRPR